MALSISTLTTFLSLNALQCDQLAGLITGSIAYKEGSVDPFENLADAIKLCEQTLNILHTIQISTRNQLCKPNKKAELSIKPNRLSRLPRECLLVTCKYIDSLSKARLRFTSMATHIDMMGCPLDLIQISRPYSTIPLLNSTAPFRVVKRQSRNLCGCDASQQLQLIDFRTVEMNQTFCSDLTESQLSLLGIGRSWSITGIKVTAYDNFIKICDILSKHNAFQSLRQLEFWVSDTQIDVITALSRRDVGVYVEDIFIRGEWNQTPFDLNIMLSPFKRLRRVDFRNVRIDGSLNDSAPQVEELGLYDTEITGNISCLAQFNNIKKFKISCNEELTCIDISSLSSCMKLTDLIIDSKNVIGNISSLISLTNLEVFHLANTMVQGEIHLLLKSLPKLKTLSLHHNTKLTGELILTGNIESLNIFRNDIHIDLSSLAHLKKLKNCYLENVSNVQGDISVMSGLRKLEVLLMDDCLYVTGSINSLATLPNLKKLTLKFLSKITGDASLFSDDVASFCRCLWVR